MVRHPTTPSKNLFFKEEFATVVTIFTVATVATIVTVVTVATAVTAVTVATVLTVATILTAVTVATVGGKFFKWTFGGWRLEGNVNSWIEF